MTDIRGRWLYHFTHVDNLPGIIAGGLVADGCGPAMVIECAEPSIKQRRRKLPVPIGPGGVVADYVPFYFAARSPMLYRIFRGGVESYQRSQQELVHLMTRVSRVEALGLKWVATDRNAAVEPGRFVNEVPELANHIDWEVMVAQQWANTTEDGSRMQRRMAEFLVHQRVPWDAFTHVVTCSDTVAETVRELVAEQAHTPGVVVRPGWYF
jgi:ssDNA thymidine ADP-ribosyltransferase, DarT